MTIRFLDGDDPDKKAQELARAWRLLRQRICKRWKVKKVSFIAVWEATKRGAPHLHIMLRGRYLKHSWLSEQMADLINSPIVSIEKIDNKDKAANYITKYITKDAHQFKGCKRYWRSQDWDLRPKSKDKEAEEAAIWTKSGGTDFQTITALLETHGGYATPHKFYWIWVPPGSAGPPKDALASLENAS